MEMAACGVSGEVLLTLVGVGAVTGGSDGDEGLVAGGSSLVVVILLVG